LAYRLTEGEIENTMYGNSNIQNVCQHFRLNEHNIIESFRIFKMYLGKGDIPKNVKPLFKAIAIIPISTGKYERNFSAIDEIISPFTVSFHYLYKLLLHCYLSTALTNLYQNSSHKNK